MATIALAFVKRDREDDNTIADPAVAMPADVELIIHYN